MAQRGSARQGEDGLGRVRPGVAMRGKSRQVKASTKGPSYDGSFFIDTHLKFC